MKTLEPPRISFALSLIQGLGGGLLGGFAYLVLLFSQRNGHNLNLAIFFAPYFMLAGAIMGSIEATILWVIYRLTGIRLRALARVSFASIVLTLLVVFGALYFELSEDRIAAWLMLALSMGIPAALLFGSRVKPWELFTFGSIAVGEVNHRSGSRSILGTLGSLPLRFLGIGATAFILLKIISEIHPIITVPTVVMTILVFAILGAYPAFSAYVTFRSPRKITLCAIGFVVNTPIALIGLLSYRVYSDAPWLGEASLRTSVYCGSFVAAWLIFLIARLNAKLSPEPSLSKENEHANRHHWSKWFRRHTFDSSPRIRGPRSGPDFQTCTER